MAVHLQREIEHLKRLILELSADVEKQLTLSVQALMDRDLDLAAKVRRMDVVVDEREVEVEEECLKILALYQPVAGDLRFIVSVLKLNNDLERIGDLACNISGRVQALDRTQWVDIPEIIPAMADRVQKMLTLCLDSFMRLDATAAQEVRRSDDAVDDLHRSIYGYVEDKLRTHPDLTLPIVSLLTVARYLERIADHITNIAEDVIYMVGGTIVRHQEPDESAATG